MNEIVLSIGLSFLSALAGAYGGARAATLWQEKKEKEAAKKEYESIIINALLLCRHYGEIISKIEDKIIRNGKELQWYEVNLTEVFMPSNLQHNAAEIISTLGKDKYDLVGGIIHAEWVAKSAIEVTQKRDNEYTTLQKFLIDKGASRMLSQNQAIDIIGEAWSAKLDSLTQEMHSAVRAAMDQNRSCFNQLVELLPNEKELKDAFERIEPTISL